MVQNDWQVELLCSWKDAEKLADEWNTLADAAVCGHPFFRHEWFSCWYPAYASTDNVRIIVIRSSDGKLRALFPGFLKTLRIGLISFRCFCYAANEYSLYGGIIAHPQDHEAIEAALGFAVEKLNPAPHLLILPLIPHQSNTGQVINNGRLPKFDRRLEHADYAVGFAMPNGWDDYFSKRTQQTRKRLKKSLTRSRKMGELRFEQFGSPTNSRQAIERLRLLDAQTWQGQQGTGLFSTRENDRFYNELLSFKYPALSARLFFAVIGGKDAAYHLTVAEGFTRFVLKSGYHPDFAYCRPGVLTKKYVGEISFAEGLQCIDLGVGVTDEKRRWETNRQRVENWWLMHRSSFRGRLLTAMLLANDAWKKTMPAGLSRRILGSMKKTS